MTLHFTVPSMACAACAETITKAIQSVDGHAQVTADLKTKTVEVETESTASALRDAITTAGYPVE